NPRIVFVPIEIKHYGLGKGEEDQDFPLVGEARLKEHLQQLESYQKQLQSLCEAYREESNIGASLLGQRLVAVLDAAIQLGSGNAELASGLLARVVFGQADVGVGKGVLLWYQAGATGIDGSKAGWIKIGDAVAVPHNEVRIDPAA